MLSQQLGRLAFVPILCLSAMTCLSQTAYFSVEGRLVSFDGQAIRTVAPRKSTGQAARVARVWGTYQGKIVATLDSELTRTEEAKDASVPDDSHDLALLTSDGSIERIVASKVVRAFPSRAGDALAYVTNERRAVICRGDSLTTLTLEGRVSHLAWSPDSTRLAIVLYPEDWSVNAVNNASTTDEFFRLQTSRIVLLDAISLAPLATVVENDGTNYNPFFSPDGTKLYYIHLDLMNDQGGVRELSLADVGTTTGKLIIPTGQQTGGVPLGRVGTYLWIGEKLILEAGTPEGGGILWTVSQDGTNPKALVEGRFPQLLGPSRLAYLKHDGTPAVLETVPEEGSGK